MSRILITGASGLLGANLVLEAAAEHEVMARQHIGIPLRAGRASSLFPGRSLADPARRASCCGSVRPDWVMHCAAATDLDAVRASRISAQASTADMAGRLPKPVESWAPDWCTFRPMRSSTAPRGYTEEDEPKPAQRVRADQARGRAGGAGRCPAALIVRTNIFGWNAQANGAWPSGS